MVYRAPVFFDPSHLPHRSGFDWGSLPKGALVVDVGGGVGTVISVLAKALPDLQFVIQDRSAVIEDGIKVRPIA
jgi:ubiquinone/menaquinone biosynthesis C-methylase UbiE